MAKKNIRYGMRSQPVQVPTPAPAAAAPLTDGAAPAMGAAGPAGLPGAAAAAAPSKTPNVTPQQQASYDQFVNGCYRILFDANAFQATLKMIAAHGNPVQGLGAALVMVSMQVQENYRQKGQPLADAQVVLHGALEVMTTLAQVCAAAKIHTFTPQELGQVAQVAITQYIQQATKAGLINPQQVQQQNATYSAPPTFRRVLQPGDLPKNLQGGFATGAPNQGGGLMASPVSPSAPAATVSGAAPGAPSPQGLLAQGS